MAHPDLDGLLTVLFSQAQSLLDKHGEFYPFGAILDRNGRIRVVATTSDDERPLSAQLIENLIIGLRRDASAGEIRAGGICLDARVPAPGNKLPTDAICARLDHVEAAAVEVFLPYSLVNRGPIEYGRMYAVPHEHFIFRVNGTQRV